MSIFKTKKLNVSKCKDGNYTVDSLRRKSCSVKVEGNWRSRPSGRRLFNETEIRAIRSTQGTMKSIAVSYGCSTTLIYFIKNGAIYRDIV